MAASTDAMYNAESRYLHKKLKIHFSSSDILEVTRDDFLMSSSVLEEAYKSSDSPFGDVSSNELSLSLYNENGLFTPRNTSSKYHGLIRRGIKIESFIRPDEVDEWDPFGVFYVSDWQATSSGMSADIVANDALYNVINGPVPPMPVYRDVSFKDFVTIYFGYFGYDVEVDESLDFIIPYIYTSSHNDNKSFLTDLMKGALADCFCTHDGKIRIVSKVSAKETRATITDNDQIKTIAIKQSISNNYDSVVVECFKGQESSEQALVELTSLKLSPDITSTGKLTLSKSPALSIRSLKRTCSTTARIVDFQASANDFVGNLQSPIETSTDLAVIGTVLDNVIVSVGDAGDAPLKISSIFIQDEDTAENVKVVSEQYLKANMPVLELEVRGNPRIELGSLLEVDSDRYGIKFSGILIRASYEYAGNLIATFTLASTYNIEEG